MQAQKDDKNSYGEIFSEIGSSVKDLVGSEMKLLRAEVNESTQKLQKHGIQAAVFGALAAISTLPFLAFVVIGLGRLFNGRYWLSSLIVAVVCAVVGGVLAMSAFRKVQRDVKFGHTKGSFGHASETVGEKINEVKDAVKGRAA